MPYFRRTTIVCFLFSAVCLGQGKQSSDSTFKRASQEYLAGRFASAEQDFQIVVNDNPSNITGQIYLGQSRFMQKKYAEAVAPFEKARELEASGMTLNSDQHHILIDQLVISYGESGNLKKVHALLDQAIRQDSDYPLNYYNLACAFAGEGDKPKMLANLSLAFQHKDHVIKGEQMPDPRRRLVSKLRA